VESGAILHALAGAVPDVLVVLDRDGQYVDVISRRSDLPRAAEMFTRWIHLTGRKALEAQAYTPARMEAADDVPAGIPSQAIPVERGDPRAAKHARPGTIVLLVEDEPQVRLAVSRVLRRYGYTVLEGQNGLEGLALWSERGHEIALIVSDVVMPQLGGREMVRRLRDEGAAVPVLFISGYAQGATPERLDGSGRSAFLAKPFDIDVFVRMAADLIQGAPSRHAGSTSPPPHTGE
jgi:CheY-like chemotaxis protein